MNLKQQVEIGLHLKLDDVKKIMDDLNTMKKRIVRGVSEETKVANDLKKAVSGLNEVQRERIWQVRSEAAAAGLRYKDLEKFEKRALKSALAVEKARASGDELAIHAAERRYAKDLQHQSKLNKQQITHLEDFKRLTSKTKTEMVEGVTGGIKEGLSNLSSADFKSLGSLLVGSIKKGGGALQTASAVASQKSGETSGAISSVLSGLAPVLAGMSTAAAVIASLVIVIGAVLALFVHMDSRIKGLNKSLLDSGFAAGDFAANLRDLSSGMKTVRETFASDAGFDFLRKWKLTQDDALKILGAFNKAGYTKEDMTAGATTVDGQQLKMRNTAEVAIKYGNLLGETGEAMAEKIGSRMEETGQTIEEVDRGFTNLYDSAMKSGFGTSRFFNMVLQATSGLNVYNVRLEEAAGLLGLLGKSMSSIRAGQLLGDLEKRGGEKSSADRLKDAHLQGAGRAIQQHKYDATQLGGNFIDAIMKDGKFAGVIAMLMKHGIKVPEYDEKLMGGDTPEAKAARNKFVASVFGASADFSLGKRDALAQDISNVTGKEKPAVLELLNRFKVFSKRGNKTQIAAEADQYSSGTTTLLQRFDILDNVLKSRGKNWESDYLSKMAGENILGIDSAQMRDMIGIVSNQKGTFYNLDKALKDFKASKGTDEQFEDLRKQLAKDYGYTIDKQGKKYSAKVGEDGVLKITSEALTDLRDFIREFAERSSREGEQQRAIEQSQAAQVIADESTSILIVLTQIKDFLEVKLFHWMGGISDYFEELIDLTHPFGIGKKETKTIPRFGADRAKGTGLEGDSKLAFNAVAGKLDTGDIKPGDVENTLMAWRGEGDSELSREEYDTVLAKLEAWRKSKGHFSRAEQIRLYELQEKRAEVLRGNHKDKNDILKNLDYEIAKYSAPSQEDFLLRMDGSSGALTPLTQFNAQDSLTVMGARPGQAVAQAAGKGGDAPGMTFHNHFYNDARANYNQSRKLLSALKHGRPV